MWCYVDNDLETLPTLMWSQDIRRAFGLIRRVIRYESSRVYERRGGFLPGHRAIALGQAMERLMSVGTGYHDSAIVALAYKASATFRGALK